MTMSSTAVIDYEQLVRAYRESLTTVLRGFSAGADFLDMWVPDDDHHKSILNLIESAESAGVEQVSIRVGAETLKGLDLGKLERMTAQLATIRAKPDGDGVILEIHCG